MPDAPPQTPQQGQNPLAALFAMLSGAGFKHMADGIGKLAQSGVPMQALMSIPNIQSMLAGAGMKDAGNSELLQPIMKMMMPPPPPPQPNPQDLAAAMQMSSARLGPGLSGLQPPTAPGGMPG